jgi:7-cyano-7-deazaguanine reductase
MMSTMAVMGASLGIRDWAVGAASTARIWSGKGRRTRDASVAIVYYPGNGDRIMSKKPGKASKSPPLQLGRAVEWPHTPDEAKLDRVPNPQKDTNYLVRFTAPEFTSLCPVTGQPDFAHLVIDYVPGQWLLESKSLKLYVASFRNHGAFHEDCTVMIGKRIAAEIKPKFLRIGGYWYPRGGIPIDVFWQTGQLPKGMWIPEQGVVPYRGRG